MSPNLNWLVFIKLFSLFDFVMNRLKKNVTFFSFEFSWRITKKINLHGLVYAIGFKIQSLVRNGQEFYIASVVLFLHLD